MLGLSLINGLAAVLKMLFISVGSFVFSQFAEC
jgi:hypothetical protein